MRTEKKKLQEEKKKLEEHQQKLKKELDDAKEHVARLRGMGINGLPAEELRQRTRMVSGEYSRRSSGTRPSLLSRRRTSIIAR